MPAVEVEELGAPSERVVQGHSNGKYSSSLATGLRLLELFSRDQPTLGLLRMADQASLPPSTTHRYASTLVALGWLQQTSARRYELGVCAAGPGLAVIGDLARRTGCEPVLKELRERTGYTCGLLAMAGDRAIYVRRIHANGAGQYTADMDLRAGASVPLYTTAPGKAMLAALSEDRLQEVLLTPGSRSAGPYGIATEDRLIVDLNHVRELGYAVHDLQEIPGAWSLGVAVKGWPECLLAIDITVPSSTSESQTSLPWLATIVMQAARHIEASLIPANWRVGRRSRPHHPS